MSRELILLPRPWIKDPPAYAEFYRVEDRQAWRFAVTWADDYEARFTLNTPAMFHTSREVEEALRHLAGDVQKLVRDGTARAEARHRTLWPALLDALERIRPILLRKQA